MAGLEDTQFGSYHFLKRIGSGGMGEVYLAEQAKLARQVAIKVIRGASDIFTAQQATEAQIQFTREARAIAALDHPYILPLYDFGEQHGVTFLVMPYVPRGSLASVIVSGPEQRLPLPWPPALASVLLRQIAEALQFAHDCGIMHRDVKPDNILIRQFPQFPLSLQNQQASLGDHAIASNTLQVVLADFGIARFLTEPVGTTGATGTPQYSAPEQLKGHPVPASDQYALACLAYLLFTGCHIFTGTVDELHHHHLNSLPLPPSQTNPALSSQIDEVILCALAKEPLERFERIADFSLALQRVVSPETITSQSQASLHSTVSSLLSGSRAPAPPPLLTPNGDALAAMSVSAKPTQAAISDHSPTPLASNVTMREADGKPMPVPGVMRARAFLHRKTQQPTQPTTSTTLPAEIPFGEMATTPDRPRDGVVAHLPASLGQRRNKNNLLRVMLIAVAVIFLLVAVLGSHFFTPGTIASPLSQVGGSATTTNGITTGTALNQATATAAAKHSGNTPGALGGPSATPNSQGTPGVNPTATASPWPIATPTPPPATATPTPAAGANLLVNPGFEDYSGWCAWNNDNNQSACGSAFYASFLESSPPSHSGTFHRVHWSGSSSYNVTTYQNFYAPVSANYYASLWVTTGCNTTNTYFFLKNLNTGAQDGQITIPECLQNWTYERIGPIWLNQGDWFAFEVQSVNSVNQWVRFDDADLCYNC